ncbi:EH domain binding protein 1 like 1 [Balamuthia mandrillaris]
MATTNNHIHGKRYMVAIDGSLGSENAFNLACEMVSKDPGSHLFVLTVAKEEGLFAQDKVIDSLRHCQNLLVKHSFLIKQRNEDMVPAKQQHMIPFSLILGRGSHVGAAICRVVQEKGIDLLLLGRRGMTPLQNLMLLMGSTSKYCVENADCNVLTVKGSYQPEEHDSLTAVRQLEEAERARRVEEMGGRTEEKEEEQRRKERERREAALMGAVIAEEAERKRRIAEEKEQEEERKKASLMGTIIAEEEERKRRLKEIEKEEKERSRASLMGTVIAEEEERKRRLEEEELKEEERKEACSIGTTVEEEHERARRLRELYGSEEEAAEQQRREDMERYSLLLLAVTQEEMERYRRMSQDKEVEVMHIRENLNNAILSHVKRLV